jgi:hypothetical protein
VLSIYLHEQRHSQCYLKTLLASRIRSVGRWDDWKNGKKLEENGRRHIEELFRHMPRRTEENKENPVKTAGASTEV